MKDKFLVLIVAKCIVNLILYFYYTSYFNVLIVAKCIVNRIQVERYMGMSYVLIVAKCIVNSDVSANPILCT